MTTGSTLTPPSLSLGYDGDGNIQSKGVAGGAAQSYVYGKTPATWCASRWMRADRFQQARGALLRMPIAVRAALVFLLHRGPGDLVCGFLV